MTMWKQEYLLRGHLFVTTNADLTSAFDRTMNETINPDCLFDVDRQNLEVAQNICLSNKCLKGANWHELMNVEIINTSSN